MFRKLKFNFEEQLEKVLKNVILKDFNSISIGPYKKLFDIRDIWYIISLYLQIRRARECWF